MELRALVTGASGFVGRHLVRYLSKQGWEVQGCDIHPGTDVVVCDVTNREQVQGVLKHNGPFTHIFHLSGMTFVPQSVENPEECIKVNTLGTITLIQEVYRIWQSPIRFLYISTSEVYGLPIYLPIDENHPVSPQNPYAISKLTSEFYCLYEHRRRDLDVVILRPFNHSGTGQDERFVLSNFTKQFAKMEKGQIPPVLRVGNIDISRDYLHVQDVVRAYESIAKVGKSGVIYNLCSGITTSLREIIQKLQQITSISVKIEVERERIRKNDIKIILGDNKKIKAEIEWTPQFTIDDILSDLLSYWRQNV